ncbi:MAG: glycerate kinase [Spirochaetota bacterium]
MLDDLKKIYTAGIEAVNPFKAINAHVKIHENNLKIFDKNREIKSFNLEKFNRILVVGAGKATSAMAKAIEDMLGNRITSGSICVKHGHVTELKKIEQIEASHPIPDNEGLRGAEKIYNIIKGADEKDLIISLISGGGSALMPLPQSSIKLKDKQKTTDMLIKSGATIHEINSVRKHLSRLKGGNMARASYPTSVINLMISDVVGDDMDVIASGPFVPDTSDFKSALHVLHKYGLRKSVPLPVSIYLEEGAAGTHPENPGSDDHIFSNVTNIIIASNFLALKAAHEQAKALGYNSIILSSLIEGDTADTADWHCRIAREIALTGNPLARPACIISGGETTVKVKGSGKGGRNMEFAMHAAKGISGLEKMLIASVGTDGNDGPTDAAGAFSTGNTLKRIKNMSLNINNFIIDNNSYELFKTLGDLIITGPTNTNVMDIRIILAKD